MIGVGCACKVNIRNISNYTQTVTVTGGIKYLTNTADHFSFVPSGPQVLGVDQALSFQLSGYDCNKTNAAQWDMECQGKVSVQEDRGAIQGAGFQLLNDYSSAVPAFSIGRYVTFLINGGRPF